MYCSHKHFYEYTEINKYEQQKVVLILIHFIFINFVYKVRYMYRTIMDFFIEVIFSSLIRIILRQKLVINFIPGTETQT